MKKWISNIIIGCVSFIFITSCAQKKMTESKPENVDISQNLDFARRQLRYTLSNFYNYSLGYPRTVINNEHIRWVEAGDWTSGFFPGELWYLYDYTQKPFWKTKAQKWTSGLKEQQFNTGTHDVGFMMYCSYGNGYKFTKNKNYKDILVQSAQSLATRFDPDVGAIKSWDHGDWTYPVIIDNMMNLELLFWAANASGDSTLYRIAKQHALTTLKNQFRLDGGSYHVIDYDPESGKVLDKKTAQGYADSSTWARGESWGLYGFTMVYRFTYDPKFLNQAKKIAHFILANPHLPDDYIPYWDYNAPDIPDAPRDVSAAAIMSSAFIELSHYVGKTDSATYMNAAGKILQSLSASPYRAKKVGDNHGFILKKSVGNKPSNSEVSVPIVYADYYYIEANIRYQRALKNKSN